MTRDINMDLREMRKYRNYYALAVETQRAQTMLNSIEAFIVSMGLAIKKKLNV